MMKFIHRLASPQHFYSVAGRIVPWTGWASILVAIAGLYGGLVAAPADYQQGESFRIIYVHAPAAWMSLFVYAAMAAAATVNLIWKIKVADAVAAASAPIGASFTFLALVTGSLWGKPMWGTWWVWDARLTSELILLFLYLGYIGLRAAIDDRRTAAQASAVLALVGVVNIPIIHYSVEWWNTLHQGPTVVRSEGPAIHIDMLIPLVLMVVAFKLFYISLVLVRARTEVLYQERRSTWVRELVRSS